MRAVASSLQDVVNKFRRNQKTLFEIVLQGDRKKQVGNPFWAPQGLDPELDGRASRNSAAQLNFEAQMNLLEEDAQARGVVIDHVVANIQKLNQIFKEISRLALEQGTVIDRIDYNLEQACKNSGKGREELRKYNERAEGSCANKVILILLFIILVLTAICTFKFVV